MPTLQMRELRSPSSSAIEAPPQVLGLSQRPALPLGGTLPPPQGLGATSFGKGTQSEQPASSLVGLAIPNQFFLSSWEHSPELPSCHSFPSQLKTALFWEPDPPRGVAAQGHSLLMWHQAQWVLGKYTST